MATYRLSRRAEGDLFEIGTYTLETWDEDQAIRYLEELETCCRLLSDNLNLGRMRSH